jgi:hypothetical protein
MTPLQTEDDEIPDFDAMRYVIDKTDPPDA